MNANPGDALRLLVVDDDEVDRERLRRALRTMVPTPTVIESNGITAAEQELKRTTFDCVILDYFLPEGPSIEFLPRLRERAPSSAFIVLTGQSDQGIAIALMKAGASDYLSKDAFEPRRIHQAIGYAVALRRAEYKMSAAEARRTQLSACLHRFVTRTPEMVTARSFDALAKAGVAILSDVFDAAEACVVLRAGGSNVEVTRGEGTAVSLASWALGAMEQGDGVAHDGQQFAIKLRGRDDSERGLVAVRTAMQGVEPLLRQLAIMVGICSDNLVLFENAARAIRARDDVMAVVSHDLRAPLNNVRLGASLLRGDSTQGNHAVLDRVERNVTHMARLVDDLVDMVRLESGNLLVTVWPESVDDLMQTAASLVADQARDQQIRLILKKCEDDLMVVADRDRVLQVLSNLLSNAIKFTPAGGVVELAAQLENNRVRFGIRDTGCGIASDEGERVFLRFWQSDPARRRGLGLGLFIAKGVVQAHGGDLWFESQAGVGSQFFFTLPTSATANPTALQTARA